MSARRKNGRRSSPPGSSKKKQQQRQQQSRREEECEAAHAPLTPLSFSPSSTSTDGVIRRTASAGVNLYQICQQEVRSVLCTDLKRLPDVLRLLRENIFTTESLRCHLDAIPSLLAVSKTKLAALPDVQSFIWNNIESLPDWQQYLSESMPDWSLASGVKQIPSNISSLITEGINKYNLGLPQSLLSVLHTLPAACNVILDGVQAIDAVSANLSNELQTLIRNNSKVLNDVQALVQNNLHRLPHLQQVIHAHYTSWKPELKSYQFVPDWMQDNSYLLTGYRPELLSFKRCLYSLLYIHNETGNIYTHLIGALLFLSLSIYASWWLIHDHHISDRMILNFFFFGSMTCLGLSTVFHLCFAHSDRMNLLFSKLDYAGITALIYSSVVSAVYFTYYCHVNWASCYIGITTVFAVICGFLALSDMYREHQYKWVRLVLFIAFAATGIFPILHFAAVYGSAIFTVMDVEWIAGSCGMYLMGAFVYITRFPERFKPGFFDIWCHSHQLWHVFVVLAALAHFKGVHNMMMYRRQDLPCSLEQSLFAQAGNPLTMLGFGAVADQ